MKTLERRLGLGSVVAISISSMLGSGIFVLPGLAFILTGPSLWMAYLLSALCVLPAALSKSELATAMPTSGGTYVYLDRTFGPIVGTISGLGLWLSLLLKSAFALVGFGAYLSVFSKVPLQMASLALLSVIVLLNILGIGKVTGALIFVVLMSVLGLAGLGVIGVTQIDYLNFDPFLPHGIDGLVAATGFVFVSFAGVTKVAAIAEEIKKPERNLPKGIFLSLVIVTVIYCGVSFLLAGTLGVEGLSGNLKPIYSLGLSVGGYWIGMAAAVLGVLTMTSMANAGILAASRFPFAMGRDRLLPGIIGTLDSRFLTPVVSIILSGIIVAGSILFFDVTKIAKLASAFMLLIYMSENIAVIVLREARMQWYKPSYRSPLYPWAQIFGIVSTLYLLTIMGLTAVTAIVAISIPGFLIYVFYARKRINRKGVIGLKGVRKDSDIEKNDVYKSEQHLHFVHLPEKASVLVALFGKEHSQDTLIEMGRALADDNTVEVVHLLEVPEQTVLSDVTEDNVQVRGIRRRIRAMIQERQANISFDPIADHDILRTTYDISKKLDSNWLLVEWVGKTRGAFTIHNPIGWLRDHLSCNIVVFRDAGIRYFKKVLVLLDKSKNDQIVVDAADHLAKVYGARLHLVRVVSENDHDYNEELERAYLEKVQSTIGSPSQFEILTAKNKMKAMVSLSADYDLMFFAQPANQSFRNRIFGTEMDSLIAQAACSVVNIQKGGKYKVRSLFH